MGKIFYIMGKSASGKDTIYKELIEKMPKFHSIVPYTTRPMREGEKDGVEYFFVDQERFDEMMDEEKIIEFRSYNTKCGIWTYFTADDGSVDLRKTSYLAIGTLESYQNLKAYYGASALCPIYVEVEDGERLKRAIAREETQKEPHYEELCRRFLADAEDFSEEKLEQAGIEKRFFNKNLETCLSEITAYIKEKEAEAKLEVDEKSKELLVGTMQKYSADITSEQTVSVIALPNDEMKGRLIGREGRNIRTIESVTGVDLIIDDTPEAIVISSFDPLRREIARLTLETLIKDGRIHPARIEELYAKTCADVRTAIKEYGKNALYKLGLSKMDPELVEIVGKLHFRSSYGQNALKHSMEVANLSGILAGELGENVNLAKRAGLLHDIGKAIDFEMEGSHVKIGADLAKKYGEDEVVINSIASHHGDVPPTSIIASIVSIADSISASRPGARNDSSENYIQRLEELEAIGNDVSGVEKAYAVQAGRELRVMVKPEEVDDLTAYQIAREIKEKIENELKYPGTIKVTVIRETRCTEEAK